MGSSPSCLGGLQNLTVELVPHAEAVALMLAACDMEGEREWEGIWDTMVSLDGFIAGLGDDMAGS